MIAAGRQQVHAHIVPPTQPPALEIPDSASNASAPTPPGSCFLEKGATKPLTVALDAGEIATACRSAICGERAPMLTPEEGSLRLPAHPTRQPAIGIPPPSHASSSAVAGTVSSCPPVPTPRCRKKPPAPLWTHLAHKSPVGPSASKSSRERTAAVPPEAAMAGACAWPRRLLSSKLGKERAPTPSRSPPSKRSNWAPAPRSQPTRRPLSRRRR